MGNIALEHLKPTIILTFLLVIIISILFYYFHLKNKIQINRWQKLLNLDKKARVFDELYKNIDGFALSREARCNQDAPEFVYGEIEFLPFIALLSLTKPNKETVFFDLGSGTGKAIIACALVYPIKKSVGIELFVQLNSCAYNLVNKLTTIHGYSATAAKIKCVRGDYYTADLKEATLIFVNSTALLGETWEKLCVLIDSLPHLQTVITTSKPLLSTTFNSISATKVEMSWGVISAYIHTRKNKFD